MRRLLALAAVVALVLVACGGDDDDDAASDDTTTSTTEERSTTTTTEADEESTTTTEAATASEPDVAALEIYAREILRWPDAEVLGEGVNHEYDVTSPTFGTAHAVLVGDDATGWQVDSLYTEMDDATASVKLGYGDDDSVTMGYQDASLTPDLTIAYGDGYANLFVRGGDPGGAASWPVELDPTLDNGPRRITVMWRDADGVARAASVLPVPAGEFAAG